MLRAMDLARRTWWVGVVAAVATSCGSIEPEGPVDEDGDPIPIPQPYDDWLRITRVEPGAQAEAIAPRPTFAVTFNQYLDDESWRSWGAARLQSNGIRYNGEVDYIMVRKTILWRPYRSVIEGLEYRFVFSMEDLRSVTDAPRTPDASYEALYARADAEEGASYELDLPQEPVRWEQVRQIFERRQCYQCHGDTEQWAYLNPLTRGSLVGERSEQVDRLLVRPFDVTDSYLMHKLLPDYPVRRYTVQPPPWFEDPQARPLDESELWAVERWIRGGAKK